MSERQTINGGEATDWTARYFLPGDTLRIAEHRSKPGQGLSYGSCNVTALEEGRAGGWDVFYGALPDGTEVAFYGFSVTVG